MATVEQQIKILQAYKEGKTIQARPKGITTDWEDIPEMGSPTWGDGVKYHLFNFSKYYYRISSPQEKGEEEEEETQQDPVKTRETGYEFIKEQITKALEPMLRPEELHREIKSYIEDRFYESCGESLNETAFEFMMKGLKGELDERITKIFKEELQIGIKAYLHELSPEMFLNKLIRDNPEIPNTLKDIATSSGNAYIRSAAADAVEKYIDESDHGYDKIWDWVQYQINEDEDLKDTLRDRIRTIAEDQITNHLSINIQLNPNKENL